MSRVETIEPRETETQAAPKTVGYGTVVTGALLVVIGALWLLDVADVLELRAAIVLPAILSVIGLALILGARGGPHPGLVVAGVFVTIAMVAAAVAPTNAFHGGIGPRQFTVTEQSGLAPRYDVGVGDLRVDMSGLVMTESATVGITVGAGEMTVVLPPGVAVEIDASAGAGQIDLLGGRSEGLSVNRTYRSVGFEDAAVTLTLDLDVAAGKIEVR